VNVLGISMARLLEPEGRFNPLPAMIRPRSDSPRFHPEIANKKKPKKKAAGRTPSGRDREKQRQYNESYRARKAAEKSGNVGKTGKRKYTRHAPVVNGNEGNGRWVLADGVD